MYRFPQTIFIKNSPHEQLDHVRSEVVELVLAYETEPIERVAEEALDLIHSLETFLRILEQRQGVKPVVIGAQIVQKNETRGYYALPD